MTPPRALRFGCVAGRPSVGRADWHDRVRAVDDAGFDTLVIPDHLGIWSPFAPLVAAAEASRRLRFGTQVLNIEFWNPVLLAREAATADVLTDGRLELGLGAGHAESEFVAAGLRYPSAAERVDHLADAVPLVRRLLAGGHVDGGGAYRVADAATGFATAQDRVPVMVGGNGDRVLRVAAEHADIVGLVGFTSGTGQTHSDLSHFSWDGLADRVALVRTAAGARADDLELSVLVQAVHVTDHRDAELDEMADGDDDRRAALAGSPFVMVGSGPALADHVSRLRDDHGVGYVTTFEPSAPALAEVIRRLR